MIDELANAAFFYGMQEALAKSDIPPELGNEFAQVRDNFYQAARSGLAAHITWNSKKLNLRQTILDVFLPLARQGLQMLDIDNADIEIYLGVIQARVESRQNGAQWQKSYVKKYGNNWHALTQTYYERQIAGEPVHNWRL